MQLILVRHGRPERIEGSDGPADPSLDDAGQRQAEALAGWLAAEPVHAIYTSPLARARETAAPLAAMLGRSAEVREGLAEWDRGQSSYIPMEELKATGHPDFRVLAERRWDLMPIDVFAFRDEVVDTIAAITRDHASETVAVVCHGGVINAYLSSVLGLADPLFFEPGYTSISRVLVSRSGARGVSTINESPHLPRP